jgi:uncharacterized membrane protein YdjX (TVP38/TMEM64 family)
MLRWTLIAAGLLACILIPFAIFDEPLSAWTLQNLKQRSQDGPAVFLWIAAALASDVFLPIPSSIVSTLAGTLLGFPKGLAASWLGMSAGSAIGYWFGRSAGQTLVRKAVGETELKRVSDLFQRFDSWAIVIGRPVPVLAEASVVAAGFLRMPFPRFAFVSALSNLGVSAAYAYAGAVAAGRDSFLIAFCASILAPGVGMALFRLLRRDPPPRD